MRDQIKNLLLIAEDDPDDRLLINEAVIEAGIPVEVNFVKDGEELLDYLYHCNHDNQDLKIQSPGLILLDLNMPKKD